MEWEKVGCGVDFERTCALYISVISASASVQVADLPRSLKGAKKHCYECGQQCQQCQARTQRICMSCPNQFCIKHDTGCSQKHVGTSVSLHVRDSASLTCSIAVRLVQYWR